MKKAPPFDTQITFPWKESKRSWFTARVNTALYRCGIRTLADLLERSRDELEEIDNLGPVSLGNIVTKLDTYGLKLRMSHRSLPPAPSLRYDFYLSDAGYQVDVFQDGNDIGGQCRDFDGSYPEGPKLDALATDLNQRIRKTIEEWRHAH